MKIICFNKRNFEKYCSEHGFSDTNPPKDFAVISICCNPETGFSVTATRISSPKTTKMSSMWSSTT